MRKAMFLLAVFGLAGSLWAADPFVGTWKLNVAKSKVPRVLKSQIVKIEAQGDIFNWTYDSVHFDGKVIHIEWSGKYDGKDYPLKGFPELDASAVKRIDAKTIGWIDKKAGKEMATWQFTVSNDGKTQSWTGKVKDAKGQEIKISSVYDKQ
jgi:hypothetical protein